MRRRTYLAASVGVVGSLAGCAGILENSGDSNDGGDGPGDAVRALYETAFDGNLEQANTHVHSEATIEAVDQSDIDQFQRTDAQIENVTVVDQSGDTATVETTLSAQPTDAAGRVNQTVRFDLRRNDGKWKVYGNAGRPGSTAPMSSWETAERTDADGSVTAVEFTHVSGEGIDSEALSVRVNGETATAPGDTTVRAGTTLVAPLEGPGNSLPASTDVTLIWSSSGEDAQLASHALGSPSVGTLGDSIRIDG